MVSGPSARCNAGSSVPIVRATASVVRIISCLVVFELAEGVLICLVSAFRVS